MIVDNDVTNGKPSKSRLPMDPMDEREQGKEVELKDASEDVAENVRDWKKDGVEGDSRRHP